METRSVLLSIRQRYYEKIVTGEKRGEVRRSFPKDWRGSMLYVYVPTPVKALVGAIVVKDVRHLKVHDLWLASQQHVALSEDEFFAYFAGKDYGFVIMIERFCKLERSVSLTALREAYPHFYPPQSFQYLSREFEEYIAHCQNL